MRNNKLTNLLKKDFHIVERRNIFFIISAAVLLLALVLALTVLPPKIGMEFEGGYTLSVEYSGGILTEDNYETKKNELVNMLEGLKDPDTNKLYGVKVSNPQLQGDGDTRAILIRFKAFSDSETYMATAIADIETQLAKMLENPEWPHAIRIKNAGTTTATISSETLIYALSALIAAAVAMFIYIMFRFKFASGISAIIAMLHDLAIMLAFMIFLRIEFTSSFIAAFITILGYSINVTLIIFDRIREMKDSSDYAKVPNIQIANKALKDTVIRALNTSVVVLFTLVAMTVLGVDSIRQFTAPIIVGLLSGIYSSFFIAPAMWTMISNSQDRARAKKEEGSKAQEKSKGAKAKAN